MNKNDLKKDLSQLIDKHWDKPVKLADAYYEVSHDDKELLICHDDKLPIEISLTDLVTRAIDDVPAEESFAHEDLQFHHEADLLEAQAKRLRQHAYRIAEAHSEAYDKLEERLEKMEGKK